MSDTTSVNRLHCPHCGALNRVPEWPEQGDATPSSIRREPGEHSLQVHCGTCRRDWFVVWTTDPGPLQPVATKTPAELLADGLAALKEKRVDEALAALEAYVAAEPGQFEGRMFLGAAFGLKGDAARAVREIEAAVTLNPNHVGARYNLAIALRQLGDTEEALAALRAALTLKPDHEPARKAWTAWTGEPPYQPPRLATLKMTKQGSLPWQPGEKASALTFTPDGTGLLASTGPGEWTLRGAADLKPIRMYGEPDRLATVGPAAFTPDGRLLLVASHEYELWQVSPRQRLHRLAACGAEVTDLACSPDSRLVAAARVSTADEPGHQLRVWEVESVKEIVGPDGAKKIGDGNYTISAIAFAPDGRWLAAACADRALRVWSWPGFAPQPVLYHEYAVTEVVFVDAERVLTCQASPGSGTVTLWRLSTQVAERTLSADGQVRGMALAPGGGGVWLACSKGLLYWRFTEDGPRYREPTPALAVALAPDGGRLAVGVSETTAEVFAIPAGLL